MTYDYNMQGTVDHMVRFARSLCQNFETLREQGHAKWREVDLSMPDLAAGWIYYPPTAREIRTCVAAQKTKVQAKAKKTCIPEERILGLCG